MGLLAVVLPPLAVPALVLTLIGALSFPAEARGRARLVGRVAMGVAALGSVVGLGRFAASKAMLGIVESGQSASAQSALWRLREVVLAEDAVRKTAPWDPDADGIGSASLIGGLVGTAPVRDDQRVKAPLLNYAFRGSVETPIGPATRVEGYLFIVCLPAKGGGFTARPGEPVDDELAERRFLAYAWPGGAARGMSTTFFTDEHERILVLDLPRGAPALYFGKDRPPACNAALGADGAPWKAWKNKQARKTLPGDRGVSAE